MLEDRSLKPHPLVHWIKKNWLDVGFLALMIGAVIFLVSLQTRVAANSKLLDGESIREIEQLNKDSIALLEVLHYTSRNNNVEALLALESFLQSAPSEEGHFLALEMQARVLWQYLEPGDPDKRLPQIRKLAKKMKDLDDTRYNGYHWEGIALERTWMNDKRDTKALEKAARAYEMSIDREPSQLKDHVNLGEVQVLLGNYTQAQVQLQKARYSIGHLTECDKIVLHFLIAIGEVLDDDDDNLTYDQTLDLLTHAIDSDMKCRVVYNVDPIKFMLDGEGWADGDCGRELAKTLTAKMEILTSPKQ